MEPSSPKYSYWDKGRLLANDMEDSISVAIGYDEYFGEQFIIDLAFLMPLLLLLLYHANTVFF